VAALSLVLVLLWTAGVTAHAQCAMCQGSSGAGADGGAAYNRSTLFMLSVPYLLLGGVAGYIVYAFRRSRNSLDGSPSPIPESASSAPPQDEQT